MAIKKVISKVRKWGGWRKVIEIPKAVRDEFNVGEEVEVKKVGKSIEKNLTI
jgi:antitoxin component of MazEF toxin-antitoxin module